MSQVMESERISSAIAVACVSVGSREDNQTELQQFSTPPTIAYLAARLLKPQSIDRILEPSAGTGSLAIWPRSVGAATICNEINPRRRALLTQALAFEAYGVDAEIIDDLLPAEVQPTEVLMNPPFSATGGRVVKHSTRYVALVSTKLNTVARPSR